MSIITITRGTKSGGVELANCLSKRLGYKTLSIEVLSESAKKYNIMEDVLLEKLAKTPSRWQKFTNEYERYIIYIRCALLAAIKQDNIIYHGYAGQFLLRGLPHVLKVRIEAPLEYRISKVMSESNKSHDEALDYIKNVDEQRKRWVKMVYGDDWYNPSLYDLWVNLENMSIEDICDIIAMTIKKKNFETSEEALRILNNKSLECEVVAAMASNDKLWSSKQVEIIAHDGDITLRGTVKNKELLDLIVDTAKKIKGVQGCHPRVNLLTDKISKE